MTLDPNMSVLRTSAHQKRHQAWKPMNWGSFWYPCCLCQSMSDPHNQRKTDFGQQFPKFSILLLFIPTFNIPQSCIFWTFLWRISMQNFALDNFELHKKVQKSNGFEVTGHFLAVIEVFQKSWKSYIAKKC